MKKTITAYCHRTKMAGMQACSYDVYFLKSDKPSHPLHRNGSYCTTIISSRDGKRREFFHVVDAIMPKSHWNMELGWEKWDAFKKLEAVADRLAIRIARRAFPELKGHKRLPALWTSSNEETKSVKVKVQITLPE